jgi:hypothetical protein
MRPPIDSRLQQTNVAQSISLHMQLLTPDNAPDDLRYSCRTWLMIESLPWILDLMCYRAAEKLSTTSEFAIMNAIPRHHHSALSACMSGTSQEAPMFGRSVA